MSEKTGITIDAVTGQTIVAPLSQEEIDFIEASKAEAEAESQAKADARTSALAKLAALGLTEAEIAAL
jgi:DNA-binding NarL/FixJ family response regulator